MTRYHATAEGQVPFAVEEEAERDAEEAAALANKPKAAIREQIVALEALITDRMKREALLGRTAVDPRNGKTAKQQIQAIDDQIEILRAQAT